MICERLLLPFGLCEMTRAHHFYRDKRERIAPDAEKLVRVVQESDCLSFGLLRRASRPRHDRGKEDWIPKAFDLIAVSERSLSSQRWTDEIKQIDHDARIATAVVEIAYPAIALN